MQRLDICWTISGEDFDETLSPLSPLRERKSSRHGLRVHRSCSIYNFPIRNRSLRKLRPQVESLTMRPQVNHWTVMLYFLLCTVLSQPAETIVMACVPLVSAKLFYLKRSEEHTSEL